jgi:PAS domain S-box-containing protein
LSIGPNDIFANYSDWHSLLFRQSICAMFVYRRTPDGDPGVLLDVNETACTMLGYTREELLKLTMLDISAPERYANYAAYKAKLDSKKHIVTETVKLTKDGRRIPSELSSHLFEIDGNPFVLSIIRDITARKKADVVLKESEWWHRMIVDSANDAVFVYRRTPNGSWSNFIEVNQAACDILGYTREELFGMGPQDIVHADDIGRIAYVREKLQKEKRVVFETFDVAKDGSKVPMEVSAHLFEIGKQNIVVGVARNIAERRKVEDELRENEEQYRMLFNSSNDAVLVHFMESDGTYGNYIEVNDVACNMFGYSREQLLRMAPKDLVAPEKRANLAAKQAGIILGDTQRVIESLLLCADGTKLAVEVSSHTFSYKQRYLVIAVARDITKRRRAQKEILKLSHAVGQSFDGIAINDKTRKIIYANETYASMHGYTQKELRKFGFKNLLWNDGEDKWKLIRALVVKEDSWSGEVNHVRKDGTVFPVYISATRLKDDNGDQVGVLSICRDITERKKTEDELVSSQQRYYTLLNSAYDGVSLHEMNDRGRPGMYVEVNDAFCQRIGYTRKELLNLTPWDVVVRRGASRIKQLRDELLAKKGIVFDVTELAKDGTTRPVEVTARLLELKGKNYVLSISRDVTERKRIEGELRENEERYRMLFNSSNDAVMVHHMDAQGNYGNYIEANDEACRMFGYTRKQLLNLRPRDLVAPERVNTLDAKHTRVLAKDKHTVFETALQARDGVTIPVEVSSHGFDYKGRHLVIAVIRDITERKRTESQLAEAQEKLTRNEKLAALGQLASGIAHDMGTPLTVIANVVDYLRETLVDLDDITMTQLDRLERQANIANNIASDLLDFSKVREPEFSEMQIRNAVKEALYPLAIPESIVLELEIDQVLPKVLIDSDQMARVFSNIVKNAYLSMPNGGKLQIRTRHDDKYVLTEIVDTGVGIPIYDMRKIFEPLFTTRSKQGSTGIGLAICKSIVEAHSGVIEVDSQEGVGTTFIIKLPIPA